MLKDFTDVRARWKNKRMQETYADVVLPWPDIKSASVLCMGGICKYKIAAGVHISDAWLSDHVWLPGLAVLVDRMKANQSDQRTFANVQRTCTCYGPSMNLVLGATKQLECSIYQREERSDLPTVGGRLFGTQWTGW